MSGKESVERTQVGQAYPGDAWAEKVKKMSDTQVIAVHKRLKEQGKIK
jgi:hypothetical protein